VTHVIGLDVAPLTGLDATGVELATFLEMLIAKPGDTETTVDTEVNGDDDTPVETEGIADPEAADIDMVTLEPPATSDDDTIMLTAPELDTTPTTELESPTMANDKV
jgi:hypothetical protein